MYTRKFMREKRKDRIRAKIRGTAKRPRLTVFRSNTSLYAQLIDDDTGKTIVAKHMRGSSMVKAQELGATIAELAKKRKVTTAVFDRGGFRYHGVIKALADAARAGGLAF